ncbi:MAG: TrmH family RNA methyltransferase [Candidatus Acidiferrum sp.]
MKPSRQNPKESGVAQHRLRAVSSRGNARVKELHLAFSKSQLTSEGCMAIEGVRLIEEAIRSGLRVHTVFFSESAAGRAERLLPQLSTHVDALLLPDAIFAGAVTTEHPQGVAALIHPKKFALEDILKAASPLLVAALGVQDPGNLGTLLRSAEAFAASGVLLCEGTVSALNPKVVRAAAGSLFRLPSVSIAFQQALPQLRGENVRLLAASSHKGTPLHEADLRGAVCILIGNEGAGVPREAAREADAMLMIPHSDKVESLNAGMAASILLYEAARQRRSSA